MQNQKKKQQSSNNKDKKMKRREALEKKKAIDDVIKTASNEKDHLAALPPFRKYNRNGLSVSLESGSGEQLSSSVKHYVQTLLKFNMEGPFGLEWPTEEKIKHREMVSPEARYIFVREISDANANAKESSSVAGKDENAVVGFVHYRFVVEEDVPVLYVYELQLEARMQGKGLGKFLMQVIELVALKTHMGAVVLTVQKANVLAMKFYMNKMRYVISAISPSKVDPLLGAEKNYEILCKTFNHESTAILVEGKVDSDGSVY